jgi:prepilin-type N-terminal cleavage/methylation domain-containing protein
MAGFSLVEVVIVLAVALIVTAIAIPTALTQYRQYRLTSAAIGVSNFFQRCRFEAIRLNTNVSCLWVPQQGGTMFWIDQNNNGAIDPTEPQYFLPADFQVSPAGAPPPPPATPGATVLGTQGAVQFNPRGGVNIAGADVISFNYTSPALPYGYRAITITPIGRTKVWGAAQSSSSWNGI